MVYKLLAHGLFHEVLELQRFPFDRQELHINMEHNHVTQTSHIVDLYDFTRASMERAQKKKQETKIKLENREDWVKLVTAAPEIHPPFATSSQVEWLPHSASVEITERGFTSSGADRPGISLVGNYERRAGHYLWTYVFVMFIIVILPCVSLVTSAENSDDRLGLTLTLVLEKFKIISRISAANCYSFQVCYISQHAQNSL